jgi:DNA polymerase-3 subunit epsilon
VELRGGRQIGLSLVAETIDTITAEQIAPAPPIMVKVHPPRQHAPTDEELERHAAFVATLVDPIWTRLDAAR